MIFSSVHAAGMMTQKISSKWYKYLTVTISGEVIIIPWNTDHGVYDNTLTTEWVLERGRQAMGEMGQNYTIGNVYDWIGFVSKCVKKKDKY